MIALHRTNGHVVIVNADLLETVERSAAPSFVASAPPFSDEGKAAEQEVAPERGAATPHEVTVITLTTGNTLIVMEAPEAVIEAVVAFRRRVNAHAM